MTTVQPTRSTRKPPVRWDRDLSLAIDRVTVQLEAAQDPAVRDAYRRLLAGLERRIPRTRLP